MKTKRTKKESCQPFPKAMEDGRRVSVRVAGKRTTCGTGEEPRADAYADVGRACRRWLEARENHRPAWSRERIKS